MLVRRAQPHVAREVEGVRVVDELSCFLHKACYGNAVGNEKKRLPLLAHVVVRPRSLL